MLKLLHAVFVLAFASSAHAASDEELAQIREEIREVKEAYEARIDALEKRLSEAESKVQNAEADSAKAQNAAVAAQSKPASESAFNPAISLILQGTYANLSKDPDTFQIGGFIPAGDETGPGKRSFSLGESELVISASIDPYFRGWLIAALTPENEVEVEEAYFSTLSIGKGFTIKGGRFLSGIGYLNEIHEHFQDFADFPLAYEAFVGRGLADDGVQVKWVAPTDLFIELGAELGRGRVFPGSDRDKNGSSLGTVFAHVGGDVGTSHAYRAGVSYLRTSPKEREFEDVDSMGNEVVNSFSGESKTWIADFVWKWAPDGNYRVTNFKVQGEYFRRREDGTLTFDEGGAALADRYAARQSGWYLQAVYQFIPRWRAGLRFDRLDSGDADIGLVDGGILSPADFPLLASDNPKRLSAMLDFSPSEFSRLRLQLARDESRPDGTEDTQIVLQYIHSLGAHGAHRF